MEGTLIWASTAPSANSTMEWTMLSRWTSTSTCESAAPYRCIASMTSNPLLSMVAQSTVILAPMFQLGCASARAGVTASSSSKGTSRRAPPLAVRRILRKGAARSKCRHCQMAECSLSTGRMRAPVRAASARTSSPPATRLSLLARATSLPAAKARRVAFSPAKPDTATSTTSAPS